MIKTVQQNNRKQIFDIVADRGGIGVAPYKFNGKELDQETGYYYYGARYYDPSTALWLGVDPLAEKYPGVSPYVYCAGNPVKYVDPDGKWVWAVVGAAVDYSLQVYDNYSSGKSGYDAWVGDINFVSVALSAVNPCGKLKMAQVMAVEATKATVSFSQNGGLSVNTDVRDIATQTIVNTVASKVSDKVVQSSSSEALKNANKKVFQAQNKLETANRRLERVTNSTTRAQQVKNATINLQNARKEEVVADMLNKTVGTAPNAFQKGSEVLTNRLLNNEKNTQE